MYNILFPVCYEVLKKLPLGEKKWRGGANMLGRREERGDGNEK